MDVNIDQETIRRRAELRRDKFWKVRQERDPGRQRSLATDLAAVRQKEVRDIQVCCALQRRINEYKERQRLAREEVDNFVRTRAGGFDEGRLYEIAADLEAARNEVLAGYRAHVVFEELRRSVRSLLTYTELRRNLHLDIARSCSLLAQTDVRVDDEQRAILSAYSSAAEYHVNTDRRIDTDGSFIIGYFELLNLDLD
ncbi:hypothetical protein N0V94_003449, partial [Neodidymelliopsis sp. IMI 364377]